MAAEIRSLAPCLMFVGDQHGRAEEAIELYLSVFAASELLTIERWGAGEGQPEGTVKIARFRLGPTELLATDSAGDHRFGFTPASSLFVELESEEALAAAFGGLAEGGKELMPLGDYPGIGRFGWLDDRFGVSWQLRLAA